MDEIHRTGSPDGSQVSTHELVIRIDERTRTMQKTVDATSDRMTAIEARMTTVETNLSSMGPVKTVVFGGVGLVLIAVMTALLGYVIFNPPKETIREVPVVNR